MLGLYATLGERTIYQTFDTPALAKHFLNKMGNVVLHDHFQPAKGISYPMVLTDLGVMVRGNGLTPALEHTFAKNELDLPSPRWYDVWPYRGTTDVKPAPAPPEPADTSDDTPAPTAPKPAPTPKPSKEGLVTVQQIASDNHWDAKHARAALRRANVDKPPQGWAFPPSDVARITTLIKENLK